MKFFQGLRGVEAAPRCLIWPWGDSGREAVAWSIRVGRRGKGEAMGSGQASLHMKVPLSVKSLTVSKNWPALGGAAFPESARPRMPKHQKF